MALSVRPTSEFSSRLRWYIRLRWFLLLAILLPIVLSLTVSSLSGSSLRVDTLVVGVVFASNAVFFVLSRIYSSPYYDKMLAFLLMFTDVLYITYYIHMRGGIDSRSQLLYAIPILASTMLLRRAAVYLVAFGSAVAFDLLMIAQHYQWITTMLSPVPAHNETSYLTNTILFFTGILVIIGALADFVTQLLLKREQAQRAALVALRRAQSVAGLGSWEWHLDTNALVWSEELFRLLDVDMSEPNQDLMATFRRSIHPDDKDWVEGLFNRAIQNKKPFRCDFRVVHTDQSVHVIHCEGKVLLAKNGKAEQVYGTSQDITAERALEAAKGDFVSLASHQLRTPASGVRMLLAMLRDGYVGDLSSEQKRTVEEAYQANERLLHIADDLLNVAKLESGRMELNNQQIELCEWLKKLVAPQKMLAKQQSQKLTLTLPKTKTYLIGDQPRLAMVLDNLLSNARKYTPEGGVVTVTLTPGKKQHKITVADTGNGMTRAEITRLFGKFSRLDNATSRGSDGTGLGLYLAKSIVDLHKGSIKVTSKPNVGSTFAVTLPISGL